MTPAELAKLKERGVREWTIVTDPLQDMRDAGFVLFQVWVLPKHRERVVKYVRRLIRQELKI